MIQVHPKLTNYKLPPSMMRTTVNLRAGAKKDRDSEICFPELLNMIGLFK
jgi:hypothetical protein